MAAKNRDQLRNPTLCNRVWATFISFFRQVSKAIWQKTASPAHICDSAVTAMHSCGVSLQRTGGQMWAICSTRHVIDAFGPNESAPSVPPSLNRIARSNQPFCRPHRRVSNKCIADVQFQRYAPGQTDRQTDTHTDKYLSLIHI